jgi:hypothetical protein
LGLCMFYVDFGLRVCKIRHNAEMIKKRNMTRVEAEAKAELAVLIEWLNTPGVTLADMGAHPDQQQLDRMRETQTRAWIARLIEHLNDSHTEKRTIDAMVRGYVVANPRAHRQTRKGWKFKWIADRDMIQFYYERTSYATRTGGNPQGSADPHSIDHHISRANRILEVLRFAERELLYRVRRCRRCNKWFDGRNPIKRTCSDNCRARKNYKPIADLSVADKEKRRADWRESSGKYRNS